MNLIISDSTMMHGGAERVIANISNRLVELGHNVELLLFFDRPIWYELDSRITITVDEKYIGKANILRHMMWRRNYISNKKPDAVLSFLAPYNMVNIIAMIGLKTPLIVADRNDPRYVPENWVIRKLRDVLYEFADGVVLQSINNKAYFSKGIQNKSVVILNAVDVKDYEGKALTEVKDKEIVSVGRLIPQKNPWLLLEAFCEVHNKYPDYKLIYYGEGELHEDIQNRIHKLNLEDCVELRGAVTDVYEKIKNATMFVLPSEYEGMPNALLEAMCIGLPVIATKVSGATDVIENGQNGLLIDIDNRDQLVESIIKIIEDKEMRLNCSRNAVKLANSLRSDVITNQWIQFITKIG